MSVCSICGRYVWDVSRSPHRCPPQWQVQSIGDPSRNEGDGDYIDRTVYANDEDEAACSAVESDWVDGGYDGDIPEGVRVRVRRVDDDDWVTRVVTGEATVEFTARAEGE